MSGSWPFRPPKEDIKKKPKNSSVVIMSRKSDTALVRWSLLQVTEKEVAAGATADLVLRAVGEVRRWEMALLK